MTDSHHLGSIHWPECIDEQIFLDQYWQKKPLLIRGAFPEFRTPLPADELAGLSLEPDTTPRLITQDAVGAYHLEHGPFDEERFTTLTENNWSLLVTDVEKHIPELNSYLDPFRFLPNWRIDDLMVSYAPEGASVGAHVDEYDVFLLQASGMRQWSIDNQQCNDPELLADAQLKLLASFNPTDSWELAPGDMLYLPPGIGHHGIASSKDCTTWSIGFRAPKISELVVRMAEYIDEQEKQQRYTDGSIQTALPGEITGAAIERFRTLCQQTLERHDSEFTTLLGQFLTESVDPAQANEQAEQDLTLPQVLSVLQRAPFSRFAWHDTSSNNDGDGDGDVMLFVDGELHACSRSFAMDICKSDIDLEINRLQYTQSELHLLKTLVGNGSLYEHAASEE
ncbi:MAG: cupin domain-containing protein [Granulosicoccus sp.]